MEVQFARNGDSNILTPLGVPDFAEIGGVSNNVPYLAFEVRVLKEPLDSLEMHVHSSKGLVFWSKARADQLSVGTHRFEWDGSDGHGRLDTRTLKDSFTVRFSGSRGGNAIERSIAVRGRAAEESFVDVTVDGSKGRVEVELRVNIKEARARGVGENPPKGAQRSPSFSAFPPAIQGPHQRVRTFGQLRQLALDGINRYWSRLVNAPDGRSYFVRVTAVAASRDAMDDISVVYNTNRSAIRSSNPGSVRGVYSFFGNVVPERIAYNVGFLGYVGTWAYEPPDAADEEFKATAAHELGHEILSAYGGDSYSYGHRGSSTIICQKKRAIGRGGVLLPATGEIDLMKYYHGSLGSRWRWRVLASEQDVLSFLWLSRVRFR